jgi:hypothetical protein
LVTASSSGESGYSHAGVRGIAGDDRLQRLLHRIEGLGLAREPGDLDDLAQRRGQRGARRSLPGARRPHGGEPHPVLGEGARLVGAEHGRGAERLEGGEAAREDAVAGDPPGPDRHEDGQDDGEFLRDHRHRERDAGEEPVEPRAAQQAVQDEQSGADDEAECRERLHERRHLELQCGAARLDLGQRRAEASDLAPGPGRPHLRDPAPADDEGSGPRARAVVAARPFVRFDDPRALSNRCRLPGEERLVDLQSRGLDQGGVRRDAVSFGEDDDVAAHHLSTEDTSPLPVADDQRSRAGEIPERGDGASGPPLLDDRDHHDDEHRGGEQERFLEVP